MQNTPLPAQATTAPAPVVIQIPTPPTPPTPPTLPDVNRVPTSYGVFRVPQTAAEAAILQTQRDVLSSQIVNVRERRNEIARAYERASGANRAGLEQQLRVLDGRLMQMEQDLAESARALSRSTVTNTSSSTGVTHFPNLSSGQTTAVSIVFIVAVLGPLTASFGRMLWRRTSKPAMPPGWYDASQRLERLEQAVDTIAVEVERVSEGQRFMTKLMTQGAAENAAAAQSGNGAEPFAALGAGSPEQIVGQQQRDEVRVRRG
jgi:hypothetical protein